MTDFGGANTMQTRTPDACPRCHAARLRSWDELSDEEREAARRLPAPPGRAAEGRAARERRRWCVRCWHGERDDSPRQA
jgi:hypothetical protein